MNLSDDTITNLYWNMIRKRENERENDRESNRLLDEEINKEKYDKRRQQFSDKLHFLENYTNPLDTETDLLHRTKRNRLNMILMYVNSSGLPSYYIYQDDTWMQIESEVGQEYEKNKQIIFNKLIQLTDSMPTCEDTLKYQKEIKQLMHIFENVNVPSELEKCMGHL